MKPALTQPTHDDRSLENLLHGSDGADGSGADGANRAVVVVSHFAGWSEPWLALDEAALDEVRKALAQRATVVRVETGACRAFAQRHGLEILPEVLVFLGGKPAARLHGRVSAAKVIELVCEALRRNAAEADALRDLALADGHRERPSLIRSVLRRRSSAGAEIGPAAVAEPAEVLLAHAG